MTKEQLDLNKLNTLWEQITRFHGSSVNLSNITKSSQILERVQKEFNNQLFTWKSALETYGTGLYNSSGTLNKSIRDNLNTHLQTCALWVDRDPFHLIHTTFPAKIVDVCLKASAQIDDKAKQEKIKELFTNKAKKELEIRDEQRQTFDLYVRRSIRAIILTYFCQIVDGDFLSATSKTSGQTSSSYAVTVNILENKRDKNYKCRQFIKPFQQYCSLLDKLLYEIRWNICSVEIENEGKKTECGQIRDHNELVQYLAQFFFVLLPDQSMPKKKQFQRQLYYSPLEILVFKRKDEIQRLRILKDRLSEWITESSIKQIISEIKKDEFKFFENLQSLKDFYNRKISNSLLKDRDTLLSAVQKIDESQISVLNAYVRSRLQSLNNEIKSSKQKSLAQKKTQEGVRIQSQRQATSASNTAAGLSDLTSPPTPVQNWLTKTAWADTFKGRHFFMTRKKPPSKKQIQQLIQQGNKLKEVQTKKTQIQKRIQLLSSKLTQEKQKKQPIATQSATGGKTTEANALLEAYDPFAHPTT